MRRMVGWSTSASALALLSLTSLACSGSRDDSDGQSDALVANSAVTCSIARGSFVAKSTAAPDGTVKVTCSAARTVSVNGAQANVEGAGVYSFKPVVGLNLIHVEEDGADRATDIPFLFGEFQSTSTFVPKAIELRIGAGGLSRPGGVVLPLPPGRTPLTVSQVASQALRDQGNLLARFDGQSKDVSSGPFHAGITILHSDYDPRGVVVSVAPRNGGVHLDASVDSIHSQLEWYAGAFGVNLRDRLNASASRLAVSADVDLWFDAPRKAVDGTLGGHDLRVDNLHVDSAVLDGIPFGWGDNIENAISSGAQSLLNRFADPILDRVKDRIIPNLALTVSQFNLPSRLDIPYLGGSLDFNQSFDGARFDAQGMQLSLGARVSHTYTGGAQPLPAPGALHLGSGQSVFDGSRAVGVSVSMDYVNQALFAVWQQGVLNRQVTGPQSVPALGLATEAVMANAKLPPILQSEADGSATLSLGEVEIKTLLHAGPLGDVPIRVSASLSASAEVRINDAGDALVIKLDGKRTKFVAELTGLPPNSKAAASDLQDLVASLVPAIQNGLADFVSIPALAIPSVDLGKLSPGFAGRKGTFAGNLLIDASTSRVGLNGDLLAF
jgi:hypothetical protein